MGSLFVFTDFLYTFIGFSITIDYISTIVIINYTLYGELMFNIQAIGTCNSNSTFCST